MKKIIEHDHAFPRVDAGDLRDELKRIRQSGYAITYGEYVNDAVGIGALSSTQRVNWPAPSASSPPRSA